MDRNNVNSTATWLRDLASCVDYSRFRRVWLHPITEQAEQGYLAACYERVARRANSEGEYFLAYDATNHGLRCAASANFPPHALIALKVTALARSGATGEARRVMEQFLEEHQPDSTLCSAQARLYRDAGFAAAEWSDRQRFFREAATWAARGKALSRDEGGDWAYPANQEVLFRFLAGERETAQASAAEVIQHVERLSDLGSLWNQTTLAEMRLVRGEFERSGEHYRQAAEQGAAFPGDLAANRGVAAVLLQEWSRFLPVDFGLLEAWFPKPVIIVFAGHLPDAAGRATPRLSEELCRPHGPVAKRLVEHLRRTKACEGICASAPGGDVLFAEALIETGAGLTLLEPFSRDRIEKVAAARGHDWSHRLDRVFGMALRSETIACAEDADEEAQCEYATHVMLGTAMLRAERINGRLHALVLWDEADADSPKRGGTGQFVHLCKEAGISVEIINPLHLPA